MSTVWKLVPVEPGIEELKVIARSIGETAGVPNHIERAKQARSAMLSAAPDAPGEPVAWHHFAQAGKRLAAQPGLMKDLSVFVDYWGLDFYTPSDETMCTVRDVVSALLVLAQDADSAPAPEAPGAPVARAAPLVAELAAAISHAEGELSQHIETYHDYEDETPERASLRGIQHHLAGSLMGEDGQLIAIFKHPAPALPVVKVKALEWDDLGRDILSALEPTPSLSTRGEAPARTYADGLEDALSAVAALHDPDDDGWKDALDAAITAIRSLKEGK